jgi:hypothetical protein
VLPSLPLAIIRVKGKRSKIRFIPVKPRLWAYVCIRCVPRQQQTLLRRSYRRVVDTLACPSRSRASGIGPSWLPCCITVSGVKLSWQKAVFPNNILIDRGRIQVPIKATGPIVLHWPKKSPFDIAPMSC